MEPATGFATFLALTVALLVVDVVTGLRGMLRVHLTSVVLTVAGLGLAIYYAEALGDLYDLEAAGIITPIHLTLAKVTTASYLLMVITGVRTLRDRARRRSHRIAAIFVLGLTLVTAGTGAAMVANSPRLEAPDIAGSAGSAADDGGTADD